MGVMFKNSSFYQAASFRGARFEKESIFSSTFEAETDFRDVTFSANALFAGASFSHVNFQHSTIAGSASFAKAMFKGLPDFRGVVFKEDAGFPMAVFVALETYFTPDFVYATFGGDINFSGTRIDAVAYFVHATFRKSVVFGHHEEEPEDYRTVREWIFHPSKIHDLCRAIR